MDAICGILGKRDATAARAMLNAMKHRGGARHVAEGDDYTVACTSPIGEIVCLVDGAARDGAGAPLDPAGLRRACAAAKQPENLEVRGSFAAAVRVGHDWWLMRDRLGAKPLYYAEASGCLVFASELKALLASGYVVKRLNLESVDRYLTLRCVPGSETILQDVNRVRPGHVLKYARGRTTETRFAAFDMEVSAQSRPQAAETLRTLLGTALDRTPASHVLWSAGIDCAALAALRHGAQPLFVLLKSAWQQETWRARESARLLHLPLKTCKARALTEQVLLKIAYHLDEPVADPSVIPLWLIAEQTGQETSSAIGGHGADELLGGYPRFHYLQKAHGARKLVPVNLLSGILPAIPPNAFLQRGGRYLTSIRDNLGIYLSWLAVFDPREREALYTDAMKAALHGHAPLEDLIAPHFADADLTRNIVSLDLNVGLPDLLLLKNDRLMAAHGVSLEFPFLDDDVVAFAATLPSRIKYGVLSKPLLRQAMKGVLPGRIRLRARRDFRMPVSGPTMRVIENAAKETITAERVDASGLFKWAPVEQILRSSSHNVYRRRQFWALLMFFAWYRAVMES